MSKDHMVGPIGEGEVVAATSVARASVGLRVSSFNRFGRPGARPVYEVDNSALA